MLSNLPQPGPILGPIFRIRIRGESRARDFELRVADIAGQNFQPVQLVREPALDVAGQSFGQPG